MKLTKEKTTYAFGLDVVRCVALILVLTTHSVVLTGAYAYEGVTPAWTLTMGMMYLSHSCVPLFLILSGYLCGGKTLSVRYYRGIFRVLIPYVLICILGLVEGWRETKLTTVVYNILSFHANDYSWYVEMYVGLFLMIPFLNLMYHAIPTKGWKLAAIGSMVFLTMLPDVMVNFGTENVRADILPDYWNICYPVTYYLLGLWLREYAQTMKRWTAAGLVLVGWLAPLAFCVYYSLHNGRYGGATFNTFGCLTTAMTAVGLFLLMFRWKGVAVLRPVARRMSKQSLEIYLCSFLTDNLLYPRLALPFPVMVVLSLGAAWVLAELVNLLAQPLIRLCQRGYDKIFPAPGVQVQN